MPIAVTTCFCGSVDSLARNFLRRAGYPNWATIPITKGKAEAKALCDRLPQREEVTALRSFLDTASTWVVIIGWDDQSCRWADISRGGPKVSVPAEFLVKQFSGVALSEEIL